MAVSQYLRPEGLLEATRSYLTPEVVRNASSVTGEPESAARQALFSAVPAVLGGITRMASSSEGATGLANIARGGEFESLVSNPPALFGSGSSASKMTALGQDLLTKIFGDKSSAVSDVLAKSSGVSANSANRLLSMAAPLTMGVLSHHVVSQGLNAFGLSRLLSEQKDEIAAAAPVGFSRVLDSPAPTVVPSKTGAGTERKSYPEPREQRQRANYTGLEEKRTRRRGSWLPWLLFALVGLGLLLFMRGRSVRNAADVATQQAKNAGNAIGNVAEQAEGALTSIALPGGVHLSVPKGSVSYNLATFLGGSEGAPRTFVFDHLNFVSSSTDLTSDSVPTINAIATVLKAYPSSRVQLAGYTDNTGDPQANRRLSLDRANAVKGMLAEHGVSSDRMVAVGLGQDHPITSNDTENGRAQNRRLELTVTLK